MSRRKVASRGFRRLLGGDDAVTGVVAARGINFSSFEGTLVSAGGMAGADSFPVGMLQPVGKYSFHVREDRWVWSDEMYRLHGFEPGEVVPTTELVLRHKEPGQSTVAREAVSAAVRSGKPYSFWHRIVDATGRTRRVVTVWEGVRDEAGEVVEVRGYMMDVTSGFRRDAAAAVAAAFEHRAVIDQAKGMLMLLHGLPADAAFSLLQKASCSTNTKLNLLAHRLVDAFTQYADVRGMGRLRQVATRVLSGSPPLSRTETG